MLRRSTLSILASLFLSSAAQAGVVSLTAPSGLANGTKFRFLFVTAGTINATSSNIATYNTFVNSQAGGATYNGSAVSWAAVGSTTTVNARDNVGGFGSNVAIYLVNGTKIADNMTTGTGGLWSGGILSLAALDISGAQVAGLIWTGSFSNGLSKIQTSGTSGDWTLGASGGTSAFGFNTNTSGGWLDFANTTSTTSNRMYGISQELTVGPVPSPGALALLGAAGLLRRRRRG
jgi:MYXO-CTERM domain-containing protein